MDTIQRGSKGPAVILLQRCLHNCLGHSEVTIDGSFGPITEAAVKSFQADPNGMNLPEVANGVVNDDTWTALEENECYDCSDLSWTGPPADDSIAWGRMVSPEFKTRIKQIGTNIGIDVDSLMACMAFETGETFRPDIPNAAGSGAIGLIQFMPNTSQGLGTTTQALAAMTAVQQLDYVERYFQPHPNLSNIDDVYMAIFWPAAIGRSGDYVLIDQATNQTAYNQNRGLDTDGDGRIEKAEAASHPRAEKHRKMEDHLQKQEESDIGFLILKFLAKGTYSNSNIFRNMLGLGIC